MLRTQSRQQQKERKYQYYPQPSTSNSQNNTPTTTIDQHHNSIQQRISNLYIYFDQQIKKYNRLAQSRKDSNNNNHTMSNYKSSTGARNNQPPGNSKLLFSSKKHQTTDRQWRSQARDNIDNITTHNNINTNNSKQSMLKHQHQQITKQTITPPYPSSSQSIITKQPAQSNHHLQHYNSLYRSNQQSKGYTQTTAVYQWRNDDIQRGQRYSSSKYNYLLPKDYDQSRSNSRLRGFNQNNQHNCNDQSSSYYQTVDIKSTPKLDHYYQQKQQKSYSQQVKYHQTESHPKQPQIQFQQKINNVQLYQMMKSILVGQQRLQKQLLLIKHKNKQLSSTTTNQIPQQKLQNEHIYNTNIPNTFTLQQKRYTNPKITENASKKPNNNSSGASPLLNKNNEKSELSPLRQQKNTKEKENSISRLGSNIKQRKCHSAVQSKSKPTKAGKITKNKQHFYQLYKQAQRQKRISPLNTRLLISQQTKSSVWERIKSVIQRSQQQDVQSSKISHQNNRYINDHLVNTIQLQRRLKGDLVKKIYDMCENKCLYK